jgi:hypothetical protein
MLYHSEVHADARFWLEVVDEILKFIALLVGGAWTWMHYLRGRTHKRKLELRTIGKLFRKSGRLYLSIVCTLKNVGQTKYPIEQRGTACQVLAYLGSEPELFRAYPVFQEHAWIEPGEEIDHPLLVRITVDESKLIGLQVKLRIVSGDIEWDSSCIVEDPDASARPSGNSPSPS